MLSKVIGYNYGDAEIGDAYKSPINATVNGSTITCSEDPNGTTRSVKLYKWDFVRFVEDSVTGTLAAGTWTFPSVPAGSYVLAYDDNFASFPTAYLTVTE